VVLVTGDFVYRTRSKFIRYNSETPKIDTACTMHADGVVSVQTRDFVVYVTFLRMTYSQPSVDNVTILVARLFYVFRMS